jgi:hypothetical protein
MVPCGFVPHVNDNVLFLFHANDRGNIGDTGSALGHRVMGLVSLPPVGLAV